MSASFISEIYRLFTKHRAFVLILLMAVEPLSGLTQVVKDSNYSSQVGFASLCLNAVELERPFLRLGTGDYMMLRFDLFGHRPQSLRYRISHCDAMWNIDETEPYEFMTGFSDAAIDNYHFSFTTLQSYTHYYQRIPSSISTFRLSGNYILTVYDAYEPDNIILTRRFCVYEDLLQVEMSVGRPSSLAGDMMSSQEVSVAIEPRQGVYLSGLEQYMKVFLQQNGRTDNVRNVGFKGYSGGKLMYWHNEENVYEGGNCFRFVDISNLRSPMYNVMRVEQYGGEYFAILRPEEDKSRKAYTYEVVLNGGMKVNVWDRTEKHTEADYVWVNFSLPMPSPFMRGSVYIIGDLTNWLINDDSRMEWNAQYRCYTKRLLLKQGYYAYQLLFKGPNDSEATTATLEGNHFDAPNIYTAYIYLRRPTDICDRLISIKSNR